ncbi:MAG: hypothetical protein WBB01_11010 [Phormidesmis sp.]
MGTAHTSILMNDLGILAQTLFPCTSNYRPAYSVGSTVFLACHLLPGTTLQPSCTIIVKPAAPTVATVTLPSKFENTLK